MSDKYRISADLYRDVRDWLLQNDSDGPAMYEWANEGRARPDTPEKCAAEMIWIILCAGRSAQAARTIEKKVWDAINNNRPVVEVFGYKAKANAIDRAWRDRVQDYAELHEIADHDIEKMLEWCQSKPFIGDDTKFQLAKNFGADLCKPDIWLCRLAGIPDKPKRPLKVRFNACQSMCEYISEHSNDSVAAIDSMLWMACNKHVLRVDETAGPITFDPQSQIRVRPILTTDNPPQRDLFE